MGRLCIAAGIAAIALALATPATAFADDDDDHFIGMIDDQAIPYSTAKNVIVLAHSVCDYVAAGQAPGQVVDEISGPANWSVEQSDFFVGAATQVYCPA